MIRCFKVLYAEIIIMTMEKLGSRGSDGWEKRRNCSAGLDDDWAEEKRLLSI